MVLDTEEFIEIVRLQEALWDLENPDYKNMKKLKFGKTLVSRVDLIVRVLFVYSVLMMLIYLIL